MKLTWNSAQLRAIQDGITRRIARMTNGSNLTKRISAIMFQSVMQNFRDEGTDEARWPRLSPFTMFVRAYRRNRQNRTPRILQDTGELRQSIVPDSGEDFAAVGTNKQGAKLLQDGQGKTKPSQVIIGAFWRRRPRGGAIQRSARGRVLSGSAVRVSSYVMNIKGGHDVPARPFLHVRRVDIARIMAEARGYYFDPGAA